MLLLSSFSLNVYVYIYIYVGIGSLGHTCAVLARTCARTATQKLDFVDLGLRSFRVDCA